MCSVPGNILIIKRQRAFIIPVLQITIGYINLRWYKILWNVSVFASTDWTNFTIRSLYFKIRKNSVQVPVLIKLFRRCYPTGAGWGEKPKAFWNREIVRSVIPPAQLQKILWRVIVFDPSHITHFAPFACRAIIFLTCSIAGKHLVNSGGREVVPEGAKPFIVAPPGYGHQRQAQVMRIKLTLIIGLKLHVKLFINAVAFW